LVTTQIDAEPKKYESFLNAQHFLRQYDGGRYDKPEYWAAFVLLDGIGS
jgi:CHAT domain-containing protein